MEESTTERDSPPMQEPPYLQCDEWEKWGKDAVYFAAVNCPVELDDRRDAGMDVYAINPCDETLPVYRLMHFSFQIEGVHPYLTVPACAIIGYRVYVLARGSLWYSDIGFYPNEWQLAPDPSPCMIYKPDLFSLRGKLYALTYQLPAPPSSSAGDCFQLLLDDSPDWRWVSLKSPPLPSPEDQEKWYETGFEHGLHGLSCIGDSKVILHVPTLEHAIRRTYTATKEVPPVHVRRRVRFFGEQHFLVFQLDDDSDRTGKWNTFKIRPSDSWPSDLFPNHCRCFPPHLSHLDSGSPLILPVLPGKLHAFSGFTGGHSGALTLACPQEVHIKWPSKSPFGYESNLNMMRTWNLLHLSGTRYCAFVVHPDDYQPDNYKQQAPPPKGGLFVFTFDLVYEHKTVSAQVVSTNDHFSGIGFPVRFASGKACSTSTSPPRLPLAVWFD